MVDRAYLPTTNAKRVVVPSVGTRVGVRLMPRRLSNAKDGQEQDEKRAEASERDGKPEAEFDALRLLHSALPKVQLHGRNGNRRKRHTRKQDCEGAAGVLPKLLDRLPGLKDCEDNHERRAKEYRRRAGTRDRPSLR